ncbi:MAG: UDP-N-acetylmuramoyl-L-alanine--D-glutamate ligase [Rikenellaceae bacterium]|nr:UDP-N-acetylmuramoyl-L-alanine--D-glutamate ligase [Rikenellaceae bacterium]
MKRKIVVLGGGISGYGSAILAKKKGFDTFLTDMGKIAPKFKERLDEWGVEYEEGQHTEERILAADEVIKSPGIPETAPIVVKIRQHGIPIISEIEFAARYKGVAKTICITGSNGKTTTTSLIYKIMVDAGRKVSLGGNIGESFAYSVATDKYFWHVLELSSFQLDGCYKFKADIGVLTNITPDHLDRYDYKLENYARSKMRITQNQTSADAFIYSADDATTQQMLDAMDSTLKARQLPFAINTAIASGDGDAILEGHSFTATVGSRSVTIDTRKMKIEGMHNVYNAMAAALATLSAGVDSKVIKRSIYDFNPVEHRLEPAGSSGDIEWINDSKATNVDSVWYALESMKRPTVWIAGGTDKGNDYGPVKEFARRKVKALICMGLDNSKLKREFADIVPTICDCHTFEEAMQAALDVASAGDTVLLSPACASFDLFKNYEDRGHRFKEWVKNNVLDK